MNDNARTTFAKNLQYFLDRYGKTQVDLMQDLHLKQSTVSSWVTGVKYPRVDKMQMLADYFGITMAELMDNEQQKTPPTEVESERSKLHLIIDKLPKGKHEQAEAILLAAFRDELGK